MKFNLFKKPQAVAAAEPTSATTVTMAPSSVSISTSAPDLSGSNNTEISKNDMFEEIRIKFFNEIDKIPRKSHYSGIQKNLCKEVYDWIIILNLCFLN